VIVVLVAGFAYYAYYGIQKEADEIKANEANRLAQQQMDKTAGLSRGEYQKQRAASYGSAIQSSNSLAAHNQHVQETEKLMQASSNTQPSK
jgi:hypothetical protein